MIKSNMKADNEKKHEIVNEWFQYGDKDVEYNPFDGTVRRISKPDLKYSKDLEEVYYGLGVSKFFEFVEGKKPYCIEYIIKGKRYKAKITLYKMKTPVEGRNYLTYEELSNRHKTNNENLRWRAYSKKYKTKNWYHCLLCEKYSDILEQFDGIKDYLCDMVYSYVYEQANREKLCDFSGGEDVMLSSYNDTILEWLDVSLDDFLHDFIASPMYLEEAFAFGRQSSKFDYSISKLYDRYGYVMTEMVKNNSPYYKYSAFETIIFDTAWDTLPREYFGNLQDYECIWLACWSYMYDRYDVLPTFHNYVKGHKYEIDKECHTLKEDFDYYKNIAYSFVPSSEVLTEALTD